MPGTPASAAYTDEAYAMTRNGQAELALGADEKLAREGPAPVSLEPTWTAE
jgi:TctA family transporter